MLSPRLWILVHISISILSCDFVLICIPSIQIFGVIICSEKLASKLDKYLLRSPTGAVSSNCAICCARLRPIHHKINISRFTNRLHSRATISRKLETKLAYLSQRIQNERSGGSFFSAFDAPYSTNISD